MEDQGAFNRLGFYSTYRLVLTDNDRNQRTLGSLIMPPEMKDPETYDWGDENGVEVFLSRRFVKPRTLQLDFMLMADSTADFWSRYKALINMLIAPGTIRLYVDELERSFFVYYTRAINANAITLFKQDGQVCAELTLEFIEPNPSLFEAYTFLTDKDKKYIITKQGTKILIK